ncbi:TlpA family protein disulfide reductase [Marisediminicola antarctica]|uniref:Alkyl hydroperoxide reductase n=1 Tax=Marisediminicola antarctica TaxID=674079 RepID=A0A7L5AEU4_9MICO|nr:TlpA disulfide reductase family protein [Marisediminicola antarctica]QHO68412.1 alkyl hydroperoxide reductase [Marisediminicola antarctica]
MKLRLLATATVSVAALVLSGCASDPLAEEYLNGGNTNYISGDGILEVPEADRAGPISFAGETDAGEPFASTDFAGEVLVVNFWYAGCAPCRAEAPDLDALAQQYEGNGASFVGVNIYDGAETSLAFARKFGVTYPSLLDNKTGEVRLAFAGEIPPQAVPTTFVLDAEGRIAARILGQLQERSILDTIISDVLAEDG